MLKCNKWEQQNPAMAQGMMQNPQVMQQQQRVQQITNHD